MNWSWRCRDFSGQVQQERVGRAQVPSAATNMLSFLKAKPATLGGLIIYTVMYLGHWWERRLLLDNNRLAHSLQSLWKLIHDTRVFNSQSHPQLLCGISAWRCKECAKSMGFGLNFRCSLMQKRFVIRVNSRYLRRCMECMHVELEHDPFLHIPMFPSGVWPLPTTSLRLQTVRQILIEHLLALGLYRPTWEDAYRRDTLKAENMEDA